MSYLHEAFDPATLEDAKQTALSSDPADPDKFKNETQFLIEFIKTHNLLQQGVHVLDFGCGMGRVAKVLVETFDCTVLGTDMSSPMRSFAKEYVSNERFEVCETPAEGSAFDFVLAVLVLQHAQFPDIEIERLYEALSPGGVLLVVNEPKRFVPSGIDSAGFVRWEDDGISVDELLSDRFALEGRFAYYRRDDKLLSVWRKL